MIILNFSHPLSSEQLAQVEAISDGIVEQVLDIPVQVLSNRPLAIQVEKIVDEMNIPSSLLQSEVFLVNPPAYSPAAAALLAELHGRMGYFPSVLWVRPVEGSTPRRFEVAEIVDLQALRDQARRRR